MLTEEEQYARRQAVQGIMPKTPFLKSLGIVFERYDPDNVFCRSANIGRQ